MIQKALAKGQRRTHWSPLKRPSASYDVEQSLLAVGRGKYFGPGAPAGPRYHHYAFELYALRAMLDLPADASRAQLLDAMKDVIVGKAAYVGRFRQ